MADETCANCGNIIGKLQTAYIFEDRIVCSRCNYILLEELTSSRQLALLTSVDKSCRFVKGFIILLIVLTILGFFFNLIAVGMKASDIDKVKATKGCTYTDILTAELRYNESVRYAMRMLPFIGPGFAAMMEAGSNDKDLRHSISLYEHMGQTIAELKAARGPD